MFTTILASVVGFAGSLIPHLIELFRDRNGRLLDAADKAHELAIMDRQVELQKLGNQMRLEEIITQGNIEESKALYKTYYSGIKIADAITAMVRPCITAIIVWNYIKYRSVLEGVLVNAPQGVRVDLMFGENDWLLLVTVISFWFGSRTMDKLRKK